MKKEKNGFIELCRFLFCGVIFLHHSGFVGNSSTHYRFPAGFLAVEFFFLLSGCFAMKHVMEEKKVTENKIENKMAYSVGYTVAKLKRIFPYAAFGTILAYVWKWYNCAAGTGLKDRFWGIWNLPIELCFLPMTGIMPVDLGNYLNAPLWYLSVMLITLPIIIFMALKAKDLFQSFLVWILPFLINGYLLQKIGSVGTWGQFVGFTYSGVIRGFAELILGCLVYLAAEKIIIWCDQHAEKREFVLAPVLTVVELGGYLFLLYLCTISTNGYVYEAGILWLAAALAISVSGRSLTGYVKGRFFDFLGKISVPIYCMHWPMYQIVKKYAGTLSYSSKVYITFGVCILVSIILVEVIELMQRRYK